MLVFYTVSKCCCFRNEMWGRENMPRNFRRWCILLVLALRVIKQGLTVLALYVGGSCFDTVSLVCPVSVFCPHLHLRGVLSPSPSAERWLGIDWNTVSNSRLTDFGLLLLWEKQVEEHAFSYSETKASQLQQQHI